MTSNYLSNFIQSQTPDEQGIINIVEEFNFSEDILISYTHFPVIFKGKIVSDYEVSFGPNTDISFRNGKFNKIGVNILSLLKISNCIIKEIKVVPLPKGNYVSTDPNKFNSLIKYGSLKLQDSSVSIFILLNYFGRLEVKNSRINEFMLNGSDCLDVQILGIKSKNSIKQFNVKGQYNNNYNKRQIDISNCIIGEEANSHPNAFAAKGININLTDVDFISDVELTEPFITFDCDESVQFEKLSVRNISKKISESSSEAVLKGFNVKELCFLESYDKVKLEQLGIGSLQINEARGIKSLSLKGTKIDQFAISENNLNTLEIIGNEVDTKINLLKIEQFVEIFCDAKGKNIEISTLEYINCTIPKDRASRFYNIEIANLSFSGLLNHGNIIFNDITSKKEGLIKIENSDLGKMIFMKCNFRNFQMLFESSKINEIFLAGTWMPHSYNINRFITFSNESSINKRLAFTQLKKVFDNRGDSILATEYHEAELDSHFYEKNSIQKLKLIYSQYKKMYEGRGDTVKAIEYQGKELDVHRTILHKEGGQYWERFQLSLNKYSNNFGQSWQWAIICIIVSGLIFYSFYCLSLGFYLGNSTSEDKQRFWTLASYFFEFINPIRKGEFIKLEDSDYVKVTGWARVIDFFWRIVITYLGYQLIQAFRKYSKKTS
jgi:hypothetical protein